MSPLRKKVSIGLSATFASACAIGIGAGLMYAPPTPAPAPIERYRSLVDQIPASVTGISRARPSLKYEISTSYKYLRNTCPAMARVDIKSPWNLANWMDEKISAQEWKAAPYSFRMNSFRAVAVQKNTEVKLNVLGKLYDSIPSHPAFAVWVDDRMEVFSKALAADKFVARETRQWAKVRKSDKRLERYISHVGNLFVQSFLPDNQTTLPEISIAREPMGVLGQFGPFPPRVAFKFSQEDIAIKDAKKTNEIIAHEYFHFIQSIIQEWWVKDMLTDNAAFKDMGEKFFYGGRKDLAHVSNDANMDIYQNTFRERWAFHVMKATNKPEDVYFQTRTQAWIDKNPLNPDNKHPETGTLPRACYLK